MTSAGRSKADGATLHANRVLRDSGGSVPIGGGAQTQNIQYSRGEVSTYRYKRGVLKERIFYSVEAKLRADFGEGR